jgi:hypothetical protein
MASFQIYKTKNNTEVCWNNFKTGTNEVAAQYSSESFL